MAVGSGALNSISTTSNCTAVGFEALRSNTADSVTAYGSLCLSNNTTAANQSGFGNTCLLSATTNGNCSGFGFQALQQNTSPNMTAFGCQASRFNTTGVRSSSFGYQSLFLNSVGNDNTGCGYRTLASATGSGNSCFGSSAGVSITGGSGNICIGSGAGQTLMTGSNNIYIGLDSLGTGDNNICRIGQIRGVTTQSPTGLPVLIAANQQLGTVSSLRSKKENIVSIDRVSNANIIQNLIPRRFDFIGCHGEYQTYGLIVDEVEQICPDIIAKDDNNEACSIYYRHLPIMLLAEIQRLNEILTRNNIV